MATLIKNAAVVFEDRVEENFCVVFENAKITGVGLEDEFSGSEFDNEIDARGNYLSPGLIDLHCHGSFGLSMDDGVEEYQKIMSGLAAFGVTGVLSTILVKPKGKDAEYVRQLAGAKVSGTQCLGFHFEGPFLSLTGAIPPESLGPADIKRVNMLIEASKPYKAIFSVAPDFEGVMDLIPTMYQAGGTVFMTHTRASVEQTQRAIALGVRHATHFYDVFPLPDETDGGVRPCGAVEAVLADPRVSVDFILDGVHVHPVAVKMALQCKGSQKVCLITDASSGAGMKPGAYNCFNDEIVIKYEGGPARLGQKSRLPGGLAGSGLTMILAVKNAVEMLGVSISQAIEMASTNPARVLNIDDRKGKIRKGFDADLIIFDNNFKVQKTLVNGNVVYSK